VPEAEVSVDEVVEAAGLKPGEERGPSGEQQTVKGEVSGTPSWAGVSL